MHTKPQSTLKGVSAIAEAIAVAEASLGGGSATQYILQQSKQGNPSPTIQKSFKVHSPLPILISSPLAKESPQFPLPPRAAAFIFFLN